jgi:DNA-directed RNA polymerase specialized sigma24 family protein
MGTVVETARSAIGESFTEFVARCGGRLQQGLMATLGSDLGQDAASEALSYGWEHWERVGAMENPVGYLFTVGRSRGQRLRGRPVFPPAPEPAGGLPWVEPGLPAAIAALSERQRVATLLVHGGDWTYAEVGELMGLDRGTAKKHADRGLAKLRAAMEVDLDA